MARIRLSFGLVLFILFFGTALAQHNPVVRRRSRARAFIEYQCRTTRFPSLCLRCLSNYAANLTTLSHEKLAQIALQVSLSKAQATKAYVTEAVKELKATKAKDYQLIKDCLDQINDGCDQLTNSIKEIQRINQVNEVDFPWHASNVQTWMSTALTEASICMEGFSGRAFGGKKKAIIKAKVQNVAEVTSNALALFNRFAARHKASHISKPKV